MIEKFIVDALLVAAVACVVVAVVCIGIGLVFYMHVDWPPLWFRIGLFGGFVGPAVLIPIAILLEMLWGRRRG